VSQDSQLLQCTEEPAWLWQNLFLQVKHLKSKAVTAVEHPASPHASSEPTSIVEGVGEGSISTVRLGTSITYYSLIARISLFPPIISNNLVLFTGLLKSKCIDYVGTVEESPYIRDSPNF